MILIYIIIKYNVSYFYTEVPPPNNLIPSLILIILYLKCLPFIVS
jgi:hypothetical protein